MTRFSRLIVFVGAASILSSPISAQLLGGPLGGVIGGVINPIGNAVGGTVGGISGGSGDRSAGGGLLTGTFSRLGNTTGALLGPGSALGAVPGALSGAVTRNGYSDYFWPASLNQISIPPEVSAASPQLIADYRLARYRALVDANRTTLDLDPYGQPVRKRELISTNPDGRSLGLAAQAGFRVIADEQDGMLGIRLVTFAVPKGMNVRQALVAIRRAAPALREIGRAHV